MVPAALEQLKIQINEVVPAAVDRLAVAPVVAVLTVAKLVAQVRAEVGLAVTVLVVVVQVVVVQIEMVQIEMVRTKIIRIAPLRVTPTRVGTVDLLRELPLQVDPVGQVAQELAPQVLVLLTTVDPLRKTVDPLHKTVDRLRKEVPQNHPGQASQMDVADLLGQDHQIEVAGLHGQVNRVAVVDLPGQGK